jgi:hypothetical protein
MKTESMKLLVNELSTIVDGVIGLLEGNDDICHAYSIITSKDVDSLITELGYYVGAVSVKTDDVTSLVLPTGSNHLLTSLDGADMEHITRTRLHILETLLYRMNIRMGVAINV